MKLTPNQLALKRYAGLFDHKNPVIKLKLGHSFCVQKIAGEIARSLHLSKEEIELAENIGLLHDFGRFEQTQRFGGQLNSLSKDYLWDHGDNGAKLLFKDGEVKRFSNINPADYDLVGTAIRNHNKFAIEPNLNQRTKLHCQIVRDADKLDIYRILLAGGAPINFKPSLVSKKTKKQFSSHQSISQTDKEVNALRTLAFIFDINFRYTFERIHEENILEKLAEKSPHKTDLQSYLAAALDYVDQRLAQN